jgi:hypothetical protein
MIIGVTKAFTQTQTNVHPYFEQLWMPTLTDKGARNKWNQQFAPCNKQALFNHAAPTLGNIPTREHIL